jgi:hypothetical protein
MGLTTWLIMRIQLRSVLLVLQCLLQVFFSQSEFDDDLFNTQMEDLFFTQVPTSTQVPPQSQTPATNENTSRRQANKGTRKR